MEEVTCSTSGGDYQKVMIALSYMRGANAAGRFSDLSVAQHSDGLRDIVWETFSEKNQISASSLRRQAEYKLLTLKQARTETVEDFSVQMKQLIAEAHYSVEANARVLINVARNGLKNEVVEYVDQKQPGLIDGDDFAEWESQSAPPPPSQTPPRIAIPSPAGRTPPTSTPSRPSTLPGSSAMYPALGAEYMPPSARDRSHRRLRQRHRAQEPLRVVGVQGRRSRAQSKTVGER